MTHNRKISVIGLGYVGLPVAVAFGKLGRVIGFDVKQSRLQELRNGTDSTGEVPPEDLAISDILFTDRIEDLKQADFYIVAVPTPVTDAKQPDISLLLEASETVGTALKRGDIVVYESTVYPGATEEDCVPVLESVSGLTCGVDFKVGYSPERINPGDREHTFTKILKVVSGQDEISLDIISYTYESVVEVGVYKASSIKIAEAAKVIENTQRDLNIAFVNELAIIFDKMGISTSEVMAAALTKWNFLPFKPGLVGGHCIGVDPYYLTYKAEKLGYSPQVILAGRQINDGMGRYVAQRTIKEMIKAGHQILGSKVTVLGITFKENCPDLRNSRVIDILNELHEYGVELQVSDPFANEKEAQKAFNISLIPFERLKPSDAVVFAVAHGPYRNLSFSHLKLLMNERSVIVDVKSIFNKKQLAREGVYIWQL